MPSNGSGGVTVTLPVNPAMRFMFTVTRIFVPCCAVTVGESNPSEKPIGPVFSSIETVSVCSFATARSSLPSPLKSPTATEIGSLPEPKFVAALKVPSPLPSMTETQFYQYLMDVGLNVTVIMVLVVGVFLVRKRPAESPAVSS